MQDYDPPTPKLRVQSVVPSNNARQYGLYIPKNYRVPGSSVIHLVHNGQQDHAAVIHLVHNRQQDHAAAVERLSFWESSDGKCLELVA
jgi:hypothetical protein